MGISHTEFRYWNSPEIVIDANLNSDEIWMVLLDEWELIANQIECCISCDTRVCDEIDIYPTFPEFQYEYIGPSLILSHSLTYSIESQSAIYEIVP